MLAAYPKSTVRRGGGWPIFLLALLLTIGVSVPVAVPAAVPERPVPPPLTAPDPPPGPPLWMPVGGAVVRGFDARAGPYGPGHRGIDIAVSVGEVVRAPASGSVTFAGPVAGTNWVTLLVAPGVLVTLGPLLAPAMTAGQVRSRDPVGRAGPGHPLPPMGRNGPGRSPQLGPGGPGRSEPFVGPGGPGVGGATLHLSVRVDGVYVDPLAYLIDRPRPRLAPLLAPGGLPGA